MKADFNASMILKNLMRQHDSSGLWAKDCSCTWHGMARAYIERAERELVEGFGDLGS